MSIVLAKDECPKCGSLDMYLQRQPMMLDENGNVTQYIAECRECGTVVHLGSQIYNKYGIVQKESGAVEARPFVHTTKQEFDDIVVALGLLMEHPATSRYLMELMMALHKEALWRMQVKFMKAYPGLKKFAGSEE